MTASANPLPAIPDPDTRRDLIKRCTMFLCRDETGFDCLQAVASRGKHQLAEWFRVGLVLRQDYENPLVPDENPIQIVPWALHALKMNPKHLAVACMAVKLNALLRIVSDRPERPTHLGAGGFLPGKNDTAIGLDGSAIVAAKETLP